MLLHRLVLWAPRGAEARGRRGPGGRAAQQSEVLRDRISQAWRGEWETLHRGARERGEEARQRRTGGKLEGEALAREVLRRVALGEYSKAASLLGSPGMAIPSASVEEALRKLPVRRPEQRQPPPRSTTPKSIGGQRGLKNEPESGESPQRPSREPSSRWTLHKGKRMPTPTGQNAACGRATDHSKVGA